MVDFDLARLNMVESQIRTNKVTDQLVVSAFEQTARERFVSKNRQGIAYVDEAIEIGGGRYMLEPMLLARLLQAAAPEKEDIALDVACGTGYATAILASMCATVVGLDSNAELVQSGNATLSEMGVDNAALVNGPLRDGYAKQQPYNVIIINGSVPEVPQAVLDQLNEGGRLVTVEGGDRRGPGVAVLYHRSGGRVAKRVLFDAGTPQLDEFALEAGFVF